MRRVFALFESRVYGYKKVQRRYALARKAVPENGAKRLSCTLSGKGLCQYAQSHSVLMCRMAVQGVSTR